MSITSVSKPETFSPLQLGLWRLETGHQYFPYITRCFVEVEAHSLRAEVLGHDVELDAANKELSVKRNRTRLTFAPVLGRGILTYSR